MFYYTDNWIPLGFQPDKTKKLYNYRLKTGQYDNWIMLPSNVHLLPVAKLQWACDFIFLLFHFKYSDNWSKAKIEFV